MSIFMSAIFVTITSVMPQLSLSVFSSSHSATVAATVARSERCSDDRIVYSPRELMANAVEYNTNAYDSSGKTNSGFVAAVLNFGGEL